MKNLKKVLIFTIAFFIILTLCSIVKAETSCTIVANPTEITLGETSVITVTVTGGDWNLYLTGDINQTWVSSNGDETGNVTKSKEFSFTPDKVGTYTINLSGTVSDYDTKIPENATGTVTITVKEKPQEQTPTEPEQPTNPEPEQPTNPEPEKPTEPKVTITDMNTTMYANGSSINVRESHSKESRVLGQLNEGDSIKVIGKSSNGWYKVVFNGVEGYISQELLTTEKPNTNKSSTATLANLTVTPGSLNETFSREKLSYTMTVESDVESINVNATPTDSKAKVTVTGNTGLMAGTGNEIKIKVLAEDEISTKTYTIKVTKLATEEENPNIIDEPTEAVLGLSSLSIEGLKLTPSFSTNIYEYSTKLTDKTIEKLKVSAVSTFEDAKIDIIGADDIKDGENVITIIVTSANGEETVTYQIIVNKIEETNIAKVDTTQKNNSNQGIIIALIVFIVILAAILVYIIIKKKQNSKPMKIYEDGDYNETEEENQYDNNEVEEQQEGKENQENEEENYEDYDDDDDDDWGTPKRGIFGKFRKNGRHF